MRLEEKLEKVRNATVEIGDLRRSYCDGMLDKYYFYLVQYLTAGDFYRIKIVDTCDESGIPIDGIFYLKLSRIATDELIERAIT